eukprot:scaffold194505_cov13-Tisochrysis_lutea.AAC.1
MTQSANPPPPMRPQGSLGRPMLTSHQNVRLSSQLLRHGQHERCRPHAFTQEDLTFSSEFKVFAEFKSCCCVTKDLLRPVAGFHVFTVFACTANE